MKEIMIAWLQRIKGCLCKLKDKFIANAPIAIGIMFILLASILLIQHQTRSQRQQKLYDSFIAEETIDPIEETTEQSETEERVPETEGPVTHVVSIDNGTEVDFDAIWEMNSDVYAWIYLQDMDISYPILQSSLERDYYLTHNLDGSEGKPGCIYSNMPQSMDFSDFATILYGHNMLDCTMFGSLKDFYEEAFFEEHEYIYVYTPDEKLTYQIIKTSVHTDDYLLDEYSSFDEQGIHHFVELLGKKEKDSRSHDRGVEFGESDKYLVLSTCIRGDGDHRYLVIGKLIEEM